MKVSITTEAVAVELESDAAYPDAMDDLTARTLDLFKQAWAVLAGSEE